MALCLLDYIPARLHWDDKALIKQFSIGDVVVRRCSPEELENPFLKITLVELSHNFCGNKEQTISKPNDVLYSIRADEDFNLYKDKVVCEMEIKDLNTEHRYDKSFTDEKHPEVECRMAFFHDPVPCMYPHCIFRIWFNDQMVGFGNWKPTLGKKSYRKIRTKIREELASMIVRREISQRGIQ